MEIRDVIKEVAHSKKSFNTADIVKAMEGKYTRAYILRFINEFVKKDELIKIGSTRRAHYARPEMLSSLEPFFERSYKNKNLEEHLIFTECMNHFPSGKDMSEHIKSIFEYAFSEMTNNAIDHSRAKNITVRVEKKDAVFRFIIEDSGIGVFRNIMQKRKLRSELEAIQDLLKGKTTTDPKAHSGEGIFFTSKVADVFTLDSYEYQLKIDNTIDDIFINDLSPKKRGTRVTFEIDEKHAGHLNEVFERYYTDPDEMAFDKTEIKIKLYTMGTVYVSRSQAKRVLSGLEKFRTIILDFEKVPGIGQAFADEIFRVFAAKNPEITLVAINTNKATQFMIERAKNTKR